MKLGITYRYGHLSIFLVALIGCQPIYFPMRQNVPLHFEKNELQGSVSFLNGVNAQTSYSISNHLGITADYLYVNNKGENTNNKYRTHVAGEVGIGYFNNFKENWCMEVYGGYGLGNASAHGNDIDALMFYFLPIFGREYLVEGSYQKFFIQPAIGYKEDKVVSSLSINCSRVAFNQFAVTVDDVKHNTSVNPQIFITPAATVQFFFTKNVSGLIQFGYAFGLGTHPQYEYQSLLASVGLLAKIKVKK